MVIATQSKPVPYLFDKDLAVHIVFAEINHFAAEMSINGPSEDELQTLTRRLSWLVDRDLRWTDVDTLVAYAKELRQVEDGTHENLHINAAGTVDDTGHVRGSLLITMFWEIGLSLGTIKARWELAA
jgi:hypothetical protein